MAWHLPEDFNRRPRNEQAEILDWVRNVIISGSTEYRRYQTVMMRQRYAVHFACASVYTPVCARRTCASFCFASEVICLPLTELRRCGASSPEFG
ncbi:hypothetical protein [Paracoccus sp. SJTW-4]|uniref:hypothetical protein n=1 Tax=Paracoccus sp. SJTW-4 TaxID=3078428 RepID=UPI0039EAE40F